jgi:spore coat polysaccharide biosynthesis predicted glycosyltransferase SpsG
MRVGILASTGKNVGLGHLKRCLSIAISLNKLSHKIEFLMENMHSCNWISQSGFSYTLNLESSYDIIIIDKYGIDENFLKILKKNCNILARIDDGYPRVRDSITDILINSNPYGNASLYEGLLKKGCKLILGKKFVPMDQKFCSLRERYKISPSIENITVTFGGSDNIEFLKRVCKYFDNNKMFTNIFVLNGSILRNSLNDKIVSTLHLLPLINNLDDLFFISDLVICSASTTCWQLSAVGIPFICFKTAKNQIHSYNYIQDSKLGIALRSDALSNGDLQRELNALNFSKRCAMFKKSRAFIDCKGADRIAIKLTEILK